MSVDCATTRPAVAAAPCPVLCDDIFEFNHTLGPPSCQPKVFEMQPETDLCKALIEDILCQEYGLGGEMNVVVAEIPMEVLQGPYAALYAQSESGERHVDMRRPEIKRCLRRLAENGTGHMECYEGITYRFVLRKSSLVSFVTTYATNTVRGPKLNSIFVDL
ncbi:hypothetical protein FQN49_005615 [Arthroderma sp. PD_2]|nr:hypothetical protein FQN49_005615 [Arthroderma sp. PD_2]